MDPIASENAGQKPRVATAWLAGCSGCHMSLLDLDERLIELATKMRLVYSPIADVKEFPADVDVTLVEGAVANLENLTLIKTIRERTKTLVSFGDCAVNGNVTAMRNPLRLAAPVIERSYLDEVDVNPQRPDEPGIVPPLLDRVLPLHAVIAVDLFLPGCPPSANSIDYVLSELLAGRTPDLSDRLSFG